MKKYLFKKIKIIVRKFPDERERYFRFYQKFQFQKIQI